MVKKTILILAAIFVLLLSFKPICAQAKQNSGLDGVIDEQIENLNTDELDKYLQELTQSHTSLFGATSFKERIKAIISGDFKIGYNDILSAVVGLFFNQIKAYLPIFVSIIAICILCAVVTNVKSQQISQTGEIIFFVAYLSVVLLTATALFSVFNQVKTTVGGIKKQMDIAFPLLLTLMAASGSTVSVAVYKPAAAFLSGAIVSAFYNIVLPLTMLCMVFSIVGNLSSNIKLNKFVDLFKSINKWVIGVCLTVFSIFLTVQGLSSASYDGISIRAAKYAISNSVPLIGNFLSGGFDVVLAGASIIKNAVGGGAVMLLLITILSPVLAVAAFSLFLKLTCAVIDLLDGSRISAMLASIAQTLKYLTATLLGVGFMYFITIVMFICSSNSYF